MNDLTDLLDAAKKYNKIKDYIIGSELENGMVEVFITPIPVVAPVSVAKRKMYSGGEIENIPHRQTGNDIAEVYSVHDLEDGWYQIELPNGDLAEINRIDEWAANCFTNKGYILAWAKDQKNVPDSYRPDRVHTYEELAHMGIENPDHKKQPIGWIDDENMRNYFL